MTLTDYRKMLKYAVETMKEVQAKLLILEDLNIEIDFQEEITSVSTKLLKTQVELKKARTTFFKYEKI